MSSWSLHPDRVLPTGELRPIAREIYDHTAALPLISMHGHVDAAIFADDRPFLDPAQLFIVPDHYLARMLVSQGIGMADLGVSSRDGRPVETDPRAIWRRFCENWHLFRGTPTRYWLEHELVELMGAPVEPSAETADELYDHLSEQLARPEFRPRALFDRFNLEILSTTDPAASDLADHAALARDGWGEKIVPTFRPDPLLHVDLPNWLLEVEALAQASGIEVVDYASYLRALENRREYFISRGARATDHGHLSAETTPLERGDAERIVAAALAGDVDPAAAQAFSGHMLHEMARMSSEDGLVMQLHPGSLRNHDPAIEAAFGPDKGYDIPVRTEYTRALRPLLTSFGHHPNMRLIVFTLDETSFSRELAPLAGVYPAMRLGAPWWFLDSPDGMLRFREAVTETAGFYNTTGFVDDTRAYASIPARHDLARRVDAGYLARLVGEHRMTMDDAIATAIDLAYTLPQAAYPSPARASDGVGT